MGNYKFRLSDMIPNAWFYKLKDMSSKTRNNAKTQNPRKKNQTPTTQTQQTEYHPQYFSKPRHSYYFTTDPLKAEKLYTSLQNPKSNDTQFPPLNPPRKSTKRRRRSTRICRTNIKTLSPRISTRISTTTLNSTPENPSSHFESPSIDDLNNLYEFLLPELETNPHSVSDPFESLSSWSSSCSCRISSSATDIIIDMNGDDSFSRKLEKLNGFDLIPELELPPILTKPRKFNDMVSDIKKKESKPVQFQQTGSLSVQIVNGGKSKSTVKEQKMGMGNSNRRSFSSSSRIRIKSNSPKIPTKKVQSYSRKMTSKKNSRSCKEQSVSESCAIVKFSFDPQRDFRESMEEMILENNIRTSKDLEELLACYLTLNSNEYHDIIVKVFEQIWFDLTDFKL